MVKYSVKNLIPGGLGKLLAANLGEVFPPTLD